VAAYILNQSQGHGLSIHATNQKLEMLKWISYLDHVDYLSKEHGVEWRILAVKINKKEVCFILIFFFLFLKMYDDKRAHNMLSLMLNLAYKTLRLTPHTLGESRVLQLLQSMTKSLLPMFLQCYQHLHFTKCLCKCFIYMTLLVTIMFSASRNNMLILPLTYGITFLLLDLWTWISSLEIFLSFFV
jgi:hypothetical protein